MTATDFDSIREYDDQQFSAVEVFRSDRLKVVCGYFKPGQFIPVHAPSSDVMIHVQTGTGIVRDGDNQHDVEPGDIVVVQADTNRGIKAADDSELEALLVTAPPPTAGEHEPVRIGLRNDQFEPHSRES